MELNGLPAQFPGMTKSLAMPLYLRAIRLWNSLPDHVVEIDNINTFKSYLSLAAS